MGSSNSPYVHLTRLNPPDLVDHNANPIIPFASDVSMLLRSALPHSTFWASSARPVTHRNDFAIGTSCGAVHIAEDQTGWFVERHRRFPEKIFGGRTRGAEIMSVDWLTENLVLNGCRSGSVRLWDVRITDTDVESTSAPLVHPSAINHVRRMNENKIVVAGIKNQLCVYDLRYLPRVKPNPNKEWTTPLTSFPSYRNWDRSALQVGLDVLKDEMIAVGTEDERVQVFDAGTGREVMVGNGGTLGRTTTGGLARCLQFVEGEGKKEGLELYVAAGRGLEEWTW